MQELNLPKANYEFAASSARPTLASSRRGDASLYLSLEFSLMREDQALIFQDIYIYLQARSTAIAL